MEIDRQPKLRDGLMSNCQSFGSNYRPCSQSRKISIGVIVDSVPKTRPGAPKEDEAAALNAENLTPNNKNPLEGKEERQGVKAGIVRKQTEAPEKASSPWISTKTKTATLDTLHKQKQTSNLLSNSGGRNKVNGVNEPLPTYHQTSVFVSSDDEQKKSERVTYKRKGGNGTTDRVEEFSFATAQEVPGSDKGVMEDKTNKTENIMNESLKMKLRDVLGSISSPKEQLSNSQTLKVDGNNLEGDQIFDQKGDAVKPKQNSDTIETDSGSPDRTTKRPMTRSLTRKRAPAKAQPKKKKNGLSSSRNQKHQENNVFSFEEGWFGRPHDDAANGGSSASKAKKSEKRSSRFEPRKIYFLGKDNAVKLQQASDRSRIPSVTEKTSSFGSRMGVVHNFLSQNNRAYGIPKCGIREKDFHQSPMAKKADPLRDFDSPAVPGNVDEKEDSENPFMKNVDLQDGFESLTFGMKTPNKGSSPSSLPKTDQMESDFRSPAPAGRNFPVGDNCSFGSRQISKPDVYVSSAPTVSSDGTRELKDLLTRNSAPSMEEKDALLSKSSEKRDSESSEEVPPIIGEYNRCKGKVTLPPETGVAGKSNYMLRSAKRCRSNGVNKFVEISPSPKGTEESNGLQGDLDQNQEDGLSRAVALFTSALERLESKMKSKTRKKSSEILMSVADGINLQLQNVESQIQTDVGKLSCLSKAKRKRLETKFQEQEEQLKAIHERFKEDVNQHLQDCKSTLEGLDVKQTEFKGSVEKQKASHRKLLVQVEEAIENQLNDAETRITAVHKSARGRMLQLKHVIAECFKEGILC